MSSAGVRIEDAKRQVLQFFTHLLHTHAASERRIDIKSLFGDSPPRRWRHELHRAHVVQPIRELNEQHAHIIGDGDTAAIVFFGAFLVTALAGMPSIDAKLARRDPAVWQGLSAATSIVPPCANTLSLAP